MEGGPQEAMSHSLTQSQHLKTPSGGLILEILSDLVCQCWACGELWESAVSDLKFWLSDWPAKHILAPPEMLQVLGKTHH